MNKNDVIDVLSVTELTKDYIIDALSVTKVIKDDVIDVLVPGQDLGDLAKPSLTHLHPEVHVQDVQENLPEIRRQHWKYNPDSGLSLFSLGVSVCTPQTSRLVRQMAGRAPALQKNWQSFKKKNTIIMNTLYVRQTSEYLFSL